ncbi:winged helix-turn-helix transcriptional regulator [Deinococcus sp. 14RED07]|uniref:winged helix-turn-helix transcriptional regulator n=1 Tax=Deinococcus sp. 14RED07 TaxID=2745874 RepID=UPI001E39D093|nr:winged helix-turn-helix transcriptional regulator [Deinococcus sp. 14RED07]
MVFQNGSQRALAQLEARYSFRILRYLCQEPRSYSEIRELTGVASTSTLSTRLSELQEIGWIERHHRRYALTPQGARLCPAVRCVLAWYAQLDHRASVIRDVLQRTGSLGIILTLHGGPRRARDLTFPAVSRRSVMARLRELTDIGFLTRSSAAMTAPYELSEYGQRFGPAASALLSWIKEQDAHLHLTAVTGQPPESTPAVSRQPRGSRPGR